MYNVLFATQPQKFIKNLLPKQQREIIEKFKIIATNPISQDLDIKKLKGTDNHYRFRYGKYRFLYTVIEDQVLVYCYKAGSRGDIYK